MSARDLARPELLEINAIQIPQQSPDSIRLNANEAALPLEASGSGATINRYPQVRPDNVRHRISSLLGIAAENLLVTRGSTEAIDLLIRTFCRAYQDSILMAPPAFEIYRVFADIQGAETIRVALDPVKNFTFPCQEILNACTDNTRLIFVCTPNNPTGNIVDREDILRLAEARCDRSIIVVDEAYLEFSQQRSMADDVVNYDNLVVLRTLSKAYALAGARCGITIACANIVDVLVRILPPFSFASPVEDTVLKTLSESGVAQANDAIAKTVLEREKLYKALSAHETVRRIWPSEANFLFLQFHNLADVQKHLEGKGILILAMGAVGALNNCARITIGTAGENQLLLESLNDLKS